MALNNLFDKKFKIALGILALLILLNLYFLIFSANKETANNPIANVVIKGYTIKAEVVSSPQKQYLGLSNHESLCINCGMLFLFSDFDEREFVMRNMKFPLDIMFISRGKIINISENLQPEGANPGYIYRSLAPADMVLEINGGDSKKYGFKKDDSVSIIK